MIYLDRLLDSVRRSARKAGQPKASREGRLPIWGLLLLVAFGIVSCRPEETAPGAAITSRGMVVSANPLASQAGVDVLREGGNAIDAAVTVSFALAVAHPIAGQRGRRGIPPLPRRRNRQGDQRGISRDGAAAAGRDMYLNAAGDVVRSGPPWDTWRREFRGPWPGFTWPGAVSGRFPGAGCWSRPSIWPGTVSWWRNTSADPWKRPVPYWSVSMRAAASFCRRKCPAPGQTFTQPDLARTLVAIARDGAEAFYRGEIAELIERTCRLTAGS